MQPTSFWDWFHLNEERLYRLSGGDLTDALYDEISKYDSRLGVEVCTDEPVRDVIVTAQDLPEAFDSVKNLVRSAPRYERWTFVALRPAKGFMFKTEADGITLDASTLMFDPTRSESRPTELGVIVYVPGALRMDDRLAGMVERALSTGIGEELFSIVKSIGVRAGFGEEGSLPIKDLGPYIAWHLRRNS